MAIPLQTFEFREMIAILGMSPSRAKNWTVGRPFKLEPSIRTASGQGSRNLYSLEDVYLMGLADVLSRGGMSAGAIGELVAAVRAKDGWSDADTLYVSRDPKSAYRIKHREDRLPADSVVHLSIAVGRLRRRVELAVTKLRRVRTAVF